MLLKECLATALVASLLAFSATAHDTWVQSGPLVTRHNDAVHVDLMLGNHGNDHRDFKLASKITLTPCTLSIVAPDGTASDLKPLVKDMGYAEKEGYWSARIVADQKGVYQVLHTLDTLHGKTRAIKSSKSFFVSSSCFGVFPTNGTEFIKPLNSGLELVLESSLKTLGAGKEVKLKVLWNGKPLPEARVAFIPRGTVLAEGFDPDFERVADETGTVKFTPTEGNFLLAVVHHLAADESGEGYDRTHYGATMVLPIPQIPFGSDL
jgi:uncharacterized GH25 family protein